MQARDNTVKLIALTILLSLITFEAFAQIDNIEGNNVPLVRERFFYGGSFGLQFGTYTQIEVSPLLGFWLLPRVGVAVGPIYKYLKDPIGSTGVWGAKGFVRLLIIENFDNIIPIGMPLGFYAHLEYEQLSFRSDFFYTNYETERVNNQAILGGFGLSQYMGPRSSLNFSLLWQLNETELDIYDSPIIRVGLTF